MNVFVGSNGVGKTSLLKRITYSMTSCDYESIRFRKHAVIKTYGLYDNKEESLYDGLAIVICPHKIDNSTHYIEMRWYEYSNTSIENICRRSQTQ